MWRFIVMGQEFLRPQLAISESAFKGHSKHDVMNLLELCLT
jgi:hypothetical protein